MGQCLFLSMSKRVVQTINGGKKLNGLEQETFWKVHTWSDRELLSCIKPRIGEKIIKRKTI